jgi:hypothetical protein
MKTVFSGREIFHVFAAQKQWEGKTGNRNVSFRETVLYSYAQPIARIVPETSHGSKVALITSRKFSITTSGHTRAASSALSHFRVFYVPLIHLGEKQGANINYLWDMYSRAVAENMKARNLPWWIEETPEGLKPKRDYNPLCDLARDVEDFAECFGLGAYDGFGGSGAEMTWKEDTRRILAHHAARIARQNTPQAIAKREKDKAKRAAQNAEKNRQEAERRARIEKEWEERNAKEDATRAERIEAWRKGGAALFPRDLNTLSHALLRVKGDTLETSHGASVPLRDAKRLFALISKDIRSHVRGAWEHGFRVGDYELLHISENGDFRVGCHSIKYEEAARLAAEIGFAPLQETPEGWRVIEA